jgi:hypothetical protein
MVSTKVGTGQHATSDDLRVAASNKTLLHFLGPRPRYFKMTASAGGVASPPILASDKNSPPCPNDSEGPGILSGGESVPEPASALEHDMQLDITESGQAETETASSRDCSQTARSNDATRFVVSFGKDELCGVFMYADPAVVRALSQKRRK